MDLVEFPPAPARAEWASVDRRGAPPAAEVQGDFAQIFADVIHAPLKAKSVDMVVTPWLIDILPDDLREWLPRLGQWLKPGGLWVNFGPLLYSRVRASRAYTEEEIVAIAAESGFAVEKRASADLPYLQSTESGRRRIERVLTLVARKR